MFLVAVGLLELPRRRRLRLPDQPADRLLLRDRHRADRQPRPRGDDGRLRDARRRAGAVLPALPDPRRALAGAGGEVELLVAQHRPRLDVLRRPCFPLGFMQLYESVRLRLLPRPLARVPDQLDTNTLLEWIRFPGDVLFIAGGVLPLLYICWVGVRHTGRQRDARGARGHPVHRDDRARRVGGSDVRRRRAAPRALLAAAYAAVPGVGGRRPRPPRPPLPRAIAPATAPPASTSTRDLDAWECPEGEYLHRVDIDHVATIVRYRARAARLQRLSGEGRLHRLRRAAARSPARSTRGRARSRAASTGGSRCSWSRSAPSSACWRCCATRHPWSFSCSEG